VTRVAAGAQYSLALTATDQLYAFGTNTWGQLGNATNVMTTRPNPTPTRVLLPGQVGQIVRIGAGDFGVLLSGLPSTP
jgi:alpha-tubulin suppressor-like RCC1 family protein